MLRGSKLRMNFASLSAHCMVATRVRSQESDDTKRSVMTLPFTGMSVAVTTTPVSDIIGFVGVPPGDVGMGGTTQDEPAPAPVRRLVSICRTMSRCSLTFARSADPSWAEIFVYCPMTASRIDFVFAFAPAVFEPMPPNTRVKAVTALVIGGMGFFEAAIG